MFLGVSGRHATADSLSIRAIARPRVQPMPDGVTTIMEDVDLVCTDASKASLDFIRNALLRRIVFPSIRTCFPDMKPGVPAIVVTGPLDFDASGNPRYASKKIEFLRCPKCTTTELRAYVQPYQEALKSLALAIKSSQTRNQEFARTAQQVIRATRKRLENTDPDKRHKTYSAKGKMNIQVPRGRGYGKG